MKKAVFDAILADVTAGKPVRQALKDRKHSAGSFYDLIAKDEKSAERYVRAKQAQCHAMADEILELADKSRPGKIITDSAKDGTSTKTADMIERARLQVDSRKWLLSKLLPKTYGDKLELAGEVGLNVSVVQYAKSKAA